MVFDKAQSEYARDEAVIRVERNAKEIWKDAALEAVYAAAAHEEVQSESLSQA